MNTEQVEQAYQPRPGVVDVQRFWIAYPDHVAGYADMQDRINRAAGKGDTEAEALARAGE